MTTGLRYIDPPRWPDERVFGPPLPDGAEGRVLGYGGPVQYCPAHPGVEWRDSGGCWACEGAT